MTKKLTRRTAIAGAAALPLAPVAAIGWNATDDPILAIYAEWKSARSAYETTLTEAASERVNELEGRIAGMVASTAAGLAAQLRVAAIGHDCAWEGRAESGLENFVLAALAGAERLAGEA